MNVLGISGLDRSVPFKKAHWPGLEEREYRISQGHDAAAALVVDGEIVAAAAEERFNRLKHSGAFPIGAIRYVLAEAGLEPTDVDEIAHGFDYAPFRGAFMLDPLSAQQFHEVYSRDSLVQQVRQHLPGVADHRVHQVTHHLAHAASAYWTSGWDECLAVIVDGMGEVHSASVYHAAGGKLTPILTIPARDSIGILYSLITLHLGFDFNSDEYKIMGLAPYGDRSRFRSFFQNEVALRDDGSMQIPLLHLDQARDDRETHARARAYLSQHLLPARRPEEDILDIHRDAAAALQECLDRTMLHLAGHFAARTGLRRLALAGGVALNCTANGRLMESGRFDDLYIQPAAGDDGTALGAALYRASLAGPVANRRMAPPYLGPAGTAEAMQQAFQERRSRIALTPFGTTEEACREAARRIAAGQVIAWHRGRMEFGPRALGHRSILADPGRPDMRDRINAMVKKREAFRPFAPAVSLEQVDRWFDLPAGTELPYMITVVNVREAHRASLPAITHVDGSARVQTVSRTNDAAFHSLLREVGELTGRQLVLNTSFNVKGQPIVNTPLEAVDTFLGTEIDCLFVEDTLVTRRQP